jgi:hypothetical protein
MTNITAALLSDSDLLTEIARAAGAERHTTSQLLALLAEVDTRRLYLGLGYASLFVYCTQALHLSEAAAYSRITAARSTRRVTRANVRSNIWSRVSIRSRTWRRACVGCRHEAKPRPSRRR